MKQVWIQEKRPQIGWIDWSHKDSKQEAIKRIKELSTEKPGRIFRCIIRTIRTCERVVFQTTANQNTKQSK